ncbi:hypothetical protein FQ185_23385 [Pseudomonas sp. ANT_H12B]|nr:hypothetical protein [Pseudomonas sp. ANT_H12B]KAA0964321.1 hypothetical protein FQ185_23385 [Pseudomonas sp. ANT_H12B]
MKWATPDDGNCPKWLLLALAGCQTPPQKGLSPAQIAVLKQQGFELTDEGWAFVKVLATVGMKEQNIQLRGLGSTEPVTSTDTAAGWSLQ